MQNREQNKIVSSDTTNSEQELEDQLMGLGERWTVLCNWVEHRASLLEILHGDIKRFHKIKENLSTWIDATEKSLKTMEQESSFHSDPNLDLSINTPLLISQIKELKVGIFMRPVIIQL